MLVPGGVPYYYITDLLGSVRGITDDTSPTPLIAAQYEYDAYGNQMSITGPQIDSALEVGSDFGFAGYFYDSPTGLNLAGHRAYYAPIGRWLTRDPIGVSWALRGNAASFSATNLNPYTYVGDNPTSFTDPRGTCPWCIPVAVAVVLGYGIFAPSDTPQAPADIGALMGITGAGFGAMSALASSGASGIAPACIGAQESQTAQARFNLTDTVAQHAAERPFVNSPLTIQEIMDAAEGVPDPQGVPGALRWDVPGAFNDSDGIYELVYDPETDTVLHFLFRSGP